MLGEGEVELLTEAGRWADVWSSALSCTFIFTCGAVSGHASGLILGRLHRRAPPPTVCRKVKGWQAPV